MYYVNAYYDVIDEFITVYNFLNMALSSMLYVINDVISQFRCSKIIHFPLLFFLT